MSEDYDPTQPHQHAQLLFDNWTAGELGELYIWLSRRDVDANVTPHDWITSAYIADHTEEEDE